MPGTAKGLVPARALHLGPSVQVRIVSCGRYRARVTSWGSGAPPHAVIVPGLSADGRSLAPQVRLLRRLVGTVHVVDLPGFALRPSLLPTGAAIPQLAGYVACAADQLGINRALFLGHSLGGGVALHLALQRPDLVQGLVLLAPAALGRSLHWIYKLYCVPLLGRALLRPEIHLTRSTVRRELIGSLRRNDGRFVEMLVRQGTRARERALSTRAVVWANQPTMLRKLRVLLSPGGEQERFALGQRLAQLADVPTLVLWGNEDRVISALDGARCRALHPRAEVHVARGVGHMLPLEAPRWTNEHLARFIRSLGRTESRAA